MISIILIDIIMINGILISVILISVILISVILISVILISVILISVILISVILISLILKSFIVIYDIVKHISSHYDECHCANLCQVSFCYMTMSFIKGFSLICVILTNDILIRMWKKVKERWISNLIRLEGAGRKNIQQPFAHLVSSCPSTNPYAYSGGSSCCSSQLDCNGAALTGNSLCCQGTSVSCPAVSGCLIGKIICIQI
jgi:hypothetical protein